MELALKQQKQATNSGLHEWQVVLLDQIAKRGSGHTPSKSHPEYWNGSIKWISLADSSSLDQVFIDETEAKITEQGLANSSAVLHPAGTVVLSRDAGIGKSAIMRSQMAVSQHFMAWLCGPTLNNLFLYYWLQAAKPQFELVANGTTIKTIGLQYFKDLRIPLPPLHEQQALATALSDVDALLDGLVRLIAKKRNIKQAVMQQLLTGKTRLRGFSDKWEEWRLGDVADIRNEKVIPIGEWEAKPSIELENIVPGAGQVVGAQFATGKSPKYSFKKGDVLFGRLRAYLKKYWFAEYDGTCSTEIWPLRPRNHRLQPEFLFLLVQQNSFLEAAEISYGTHMPRSDWSVLSALHVELPQPNEQLAIASLILDMSREIQVLDQRLAKTRDIKQGMMQQLLTGKVRLV